MVDEGVPYPPVLGVLVFKSLVVLTATAASMTFFGFLGEPPKMIGSPRSEWMKCDLRCLGFDDGPDFQARFGPLGGVPKQIRISVGHSGNPV